MFGFRTTHSGSDNDDYSCAESKPHVRSCKWDLMSCWTFRRSPSISFLTILLTYAALFIPAECLKFIPRTPTCSVILKGSSSMDYFYTFPKVGLCVKCGNSRKQRKPSVGLDNLVGCRFLFRGNSELITNEE